MEPLSEEMLWAAVDKGPCFIRSGPAGLIRGANYAFCELLGYSESDLKAIGWIKLSVDDQDLESDKHLSEQLIDGKITIYKQWKAYRHRYGHPVPGQLIVIRHPHDGVLDSCLCWFIPVVNGSKASLELVTKYIQDHAEVTRETCKAVNDMLTQITAQPDRTKLRRMFDAMLDWGEENPGKAGTVLMFAASLWAAVPQVVQRVLPAQPVQLQLPLNPTPEEKRLINAIENQAIPVAKSMALDQIALHRYPNLAADGRITVTTPAGTSVGWNRGDRGRVAMSDLSGRDGSSSDRTGRGGFAITGPDGSVVELPGRTF